MAARVEIIDLTGNDTHIVIDLTTDDSDNDQIIIDLTDDYAHNCTVCLDLFYVSDRAFLLAECGHVSQVPDLLNVLLTVL